MTDIEFQAYLKEIFPYEINAIKRPDNPADSNLLYSKEFPQFISQDAVKFTLINALITRLLSNDERLKEWIDQLMSAINKQDFSLVTQTVKGLMSSNDKIKLDNIEAGAQVNQNTFGVIKIGNSTYTAKQVQDILQFVAGTNIKLDIDSNGLVKIGVIGIENGAQVNQNSIANVQIGTSTIAANKITDTLQIVAGSNIQITPDTINKKIRFDVPNGMQVACLTGEIGNGGTIPLPAGYTQNQCKWMIGLTKILQGSGGYTRSSVDGNRVVYFDSNVGIEACMYIIIGVK